MGTNITLRERILRYMRKHAGEWVPGAEIERLTMENTKHTGSTATRLCRTLAEEGILQRDSRFAAKTGWKKIAWYHYNKPL